MGLRPSHCSAIGLRKGQPTIDFVFNLSCGESQAIENKADGWPIIASDFCDAGFGRVSHCRCLRSGSSPCSVGTLRTQTSAAVVMEFCQRAEKEVERITGTIRSAPPWAPIRPSISHLPHSTWRCKLFYNVVVVQKLGLVTSIRGYRSHTRDTPQSPCQDENTYLQAVGDSI